MSKKLLYWLVGVLVAFFLAGVVVIVLGGATEEPPPAAIATTTASGDLRVTSQAAAVWVRKGEPAEFWLQVENSGKSAITALTLEPLDAPGFSPDECDCQAPGASCPFNEKASVSPSPPATPPPASGASTCGLLTDSLGPGQKITVWIHLRAEEVHRSEILSAGLAWKDAAGRQSAVAAAVGPISIRTWLDEWIEARVGLLQGLALPLTTFLLGAIFSVAKYFSDRADKKTDDLRASKAQAASDRREQLTQTWNRMLPASHRLALHHYVPMSAAVYEALYWLADADPVNAPVAPAQSAAAAALAVAGLKWDEAKLKRAFFGLMLFESRVRNTTTEVGGFYFKDRTGEKIVSRCYLRYRDTFYRRDSAEQLAVERVRALCSANMDLTDFEAKWNANKTQFDDLWDKFKKWVQNPEGYPKAKPILTAFRAVLDYESNRPYEYWYGKRDPLYIVAKADEMLRQDWPGFSDPIEATNFKNAVIKYLDENKKDTAPPADNQSSP